MELEFFCEPGTDLEWFSYWKQFCIDWLKALGMKEDEMRQVAAFIVEAIEKRNEPASLAAIRSRVEEFARAYPLFTW